MTDTTHPEPIHGAVLEIPLNKLKASPRNARKTPHPASEIEALAASILHKGVLQPPVVEPELDTESQPTGSYLVTIGEGRRQALLLLVKRKAIRKTHPVRCVLDLANDAHEISLDENVTRSAMHPADQFEAFQRLADEKGYGPEEIAGRFGVSPVLVRQRLKLAAVSPKLVQAYREEAMTLDQLMAFTVCDDHARQEQVWEGLGWNRSAHLIRRAVTEANVAADDRRARFVGAEAYAAAGGLIARDLFSEDDGGWFTDPALLDRLVAEKLAEAAEAVRQAEGWKWAEPLTGASGSDLTRIYPRLVERSEADAARIVELSEAYDALVEEWQHEADLPAEVEARFAQLDAELAAFGDGYAYAPEEIARAGVFVLLEHDGTLRYERGFVRPEDELAAEPETADGTDAPPPWAETSPEPEGPSAFEEGAPGPLSDSLVADLTAHRTAGLRDALAEQPELALLALLHGLALKTFHRGQGLGSCLEVDVRSVSLTGYAPGIAEGAACRSIEARHAGWAGDIPKSPGDLWGWLLGLPSEARLRLLAHCVSLSVNAVRVTERRPKGTDHAEVLASALGLDMTRYWSATAASYFSRVPKARILEAMREGYSAEAAERVAGLKKGPMADVAEEALAPRGWLPSLLRTAAAKPAAEEPEASPVVPEPQTIAAE